MKWLKKNLGTALLLVVTVAAIVYVVHDRSSLTTDEKAARKQNLFPAWRKDQISRVEVKTSAHDIVLVAKKHVTPATGGSDPASDSTAPEWDVTVDGATYPGDELAVDKFLGTLQYASYKREIAKGSIDRSAFGLESPRETIDISMADNSMHLALGAPATVKDELYAEVTDKRVFAITTDLATQLEPNPDELRSKSFVPYFSPDLASISIRGEGGDRDFERAAWNGGRGSGFKVTGSGIRADGELMDRMFVAFGKMQADAFLDDATADKASTARVTLTLTPKDGPNAVIVLGGPCPTKKNHVVAIRKEPTRLSACVPDTVMDALSQPFSAFEDKHLIGSTLDEIVELKIQDGDKVLDLARSGSGFKMRAPVDRMVSGDRGNALVNEMLLVKGELAPADAPVEGNPIAITIRSAGGESTDGAERTEELAIYPPKASKEDPEIERSVVLRKEDGRKLYVSRSVLHSFSANDLLVRDLTVTKEKPEDVSEISIDGGGKKQTIKRSDKGFDLVEPKGKGFAVDIAFASDLATDVAHLETTRWVAEADDGSFGLATPRITISAKVGASKPIKILVGARTDEGSYAKLDSDPAVFLAPNALVDDASRWLLSRAAFTLPAENIDKLVLRGDGDKRLELVRDGKQLKVKGKADHHADEVSAGVARAMDDLLPIGAVSVGDPTEAQGLKKPVLTIDASTSSGDITIVIGAGDTFERTSISYARRSGIDATYAVPASVVTQLVEMVSGH